jgi:predicted dinucleotide-binding enzyme
VSQIKSDLFLKKIVIGVCMKIGILGSTDVAKDLAKGFLGEGHEVKMSSREPSKLSDWVKGNNDKASAGTFSEAAQFGEVIVVVVNGNAIENAIRLAGFENFKGKTVIDATNPLDMSGKLPKLIGAVGSSAGERLQELLPAAHVVKAFNTVGHAHFYKPKFESTPDMFLCGNDTNAKTNVSNIIKSFGWNPIEVGGIENAHYLEATSMVWILTAFTQNQWNQAFKLLRK